MKRKQLVKNSMEYATLMTKMEGGKSQINIADMKQAISLMKKLEVALILRGGYRSALLTIRREACAMAKKIKEKKAKHQMKK